MFFPVVGFFVVQIYAATPDVAQPAVWRDQGFCAPQQKIGRKRLRSPEAQDPRSSAENDVTLGDVPLSDISEELPSSDVLKGFFENACVSNDLTRIMELYESYSNPQYSALLPEFLFPDKILDQSPYSSLNEENNATKLAVLLAAIEGNLEAQVLILPCLQTVFSDTSITFH